MLSGHDLYGWLFPQVDLGVKEEEAAPRAEVAERDQGDGEEGATAAQDWFDEDFGLTSTRREAEELRLQQLQIEQEVCFLSTLTMI